MGNHNTVGLDSGNEKYSKALSKKGWTMGNPICGTACNIICAVFPNTCCVRCIRVIHKVVVI